MTIAETGCVHQKDFEPGRKIELQQLRVQFLRRRGMRSQTWYKDNSLEASVHSVVTANLGNRMHKLSTWPPLPLVVILVRDDRCLDLCRHLLSWILHMPDSQHFQLMSKFCTFRRYNNILQG